MKLHIALIAGVLMPSTFGSSVQAQNYSVEDLTRAPSSAAPSRPSSGACLQLTTSGRLFA